MATRKIGLMRDEEHEIEQILEEVDPLLNPNISPVDWITTFFEKSNISYDYQTSSYVIDGAAVELNVVISKIRLGLFDHEMLHLKNFVADALRVIKSKKDEEYINSLKDQIKFQKRSDNYFPDLIRAITGEYDELNELVFRHWMWLVKRKIFGLPTENELMLILYGKSGSGKSYFLRKLLSSLDQVTVFTDMRVFNDKFGLRQFDRNRIMVFDELDMVGEVSVEKLKNVITAQNISWRMMRSEALMKGKQNCSFVATTNLPVSEQIQDPTSSRRYWQLDTLPKIDWDAINNINYDYLWKSIDHNAKSPIAEHIPSVHSRQNDVILYKDEIDQWVDSSVIQFPITERSPSSSKLYESFQGYCQGNGIKIYPSFNQFCRQLYPKLKSKGFDGPIKEHRHNGTIWALKTKE